MSSRPTQFFLFVKGHNDRSISLYSENMGEFYSFGEVSLDFVWIVFFLVKDGSSSTSCKICLQ